MGISISGDQFDSIDMMKDTELARHAVDLAKKKIGPIVDEMVDECCDEPIDVPLLEWIEEDYESESFTLVQSKKKKKNLLKMKQEKKESKSPLRRSKRTTPSLYRKDGGKENLAHATKSKEIVK
jgi:hypothetical protein